MLSQYRLFVLEEDLRPCSTAFRTIRYALWCYTWRFELDQKAQGPWRFQIRNWAQHSPDDTGYRCSRVSGIDLPIFVFYCWPLRTTFSLNLAVASRIYILEPQWNPFIEFQAMARAQRLGQTKQVTVIRYIMERTIEQVGILSSSMSLICVLTRQ